MWTPNIYQAVVIILIVVAIFFLFARRRRSNTKKGKKKSGARKERIKDADSRDAEEQHEEQHEEDDEENDEENDEGKEELKQADGKDRAAELYRLLHGPFSRGEIAERGQFQEIAGNLANDIVYLELKQLYGQNKGVRISDYQGILERAGVAS